MEAVLLMHSQLLSTATTRRAARASTRVVSPNEQPSSRTPSSDETNVDASFRYGAVSAQTIKAGLDKLFRLGKCAVLMLHRYAFTLVEDASLAAWSDACIGRQTRDKSDSNILRYIGSY